MDLLFVHSCTESDLNTAIFSNTAATPQALSRFPGRLS
jgi:hypothetical protein